MRFHLLLLPLALAACATTPAAEPPAAPDAATLAAYHWQLDSATNRAGARIDDLFVRPDRPLELDFAAGHISVRNSCNAMGGSYRIDAGALVAGPFVHTMMACADPMLNHLDQAISARLTGKPALALTSKGGRHELQLRTADGDTLGFAGVPTAQTRYGSAGDTVFLEVAPQTVPCQHPLMPNAQCLDVREVHYDAQGLKTGTPGAWQPLARIEGFTHVDGTRNVLRVKRYALKHPPADDAPGVAYVLDMVVESDISGRASGH